MPLYEQMKKTVIYILFLLPIYLSGQQVKIVKKETFESKVDTSKRINDKVVYQEPEQTEISIRGQVYPALVTGGDTLILADFDEISITSKRHFVDDAERRKYEKMRRYAIKVYPYAKEAIRIFREVEYASEHLKRRQRKREMKRLEKELRNEFEEPLTKLTKLQGKILVKMIERELGQSMHSLIKMHRGGFKAFYWHNMGKLYSYDLKEGYQEGKYKILDIILQDFDVSFELDKRADLKYIKKKFNG